ncbi:hypothetical protein [Aureivirga sp. CE67]|uniref:hypothetical protein n=1 Tax=Aureivirga sp. CE67 TaxID=1788983 RepID=UPI0018C99325|nr:hypothetical protein [Aureivirga sp. CE67]
MNNKSLRVLFVIVAFLCFENASSQNKKYRTGILAGYNNYKTSSNFADAKTGNGFHIGFIDDMYIGDKFGFTFAFIYQRNYVPFNTTSSGYSYSNDNYKTFTADNLDVPLKFYYNLLNINDKLIVSTNFGTTLKFFYGYDRKGSDDINLSPGGYEAKFLDSDGFVNLFWSTGFQIEYKKTAISFNYSKSISNPYRNIELRSTDFFDPNAKFFKGNDNYFSISFICFFNNRI